MTPQSPYMACIFVCAITVLLSLRCDSVHAQQAQHASASGDSAIDVGLLHLDSLKTIEGRLLKAIKSPSGNVRMQPKIMARSGLEAGKSAAVKLLDSFPPVAREKSQLLRDQLKNISADSLRKTGDNSIKNLWRGQKAIVAHQAAALTPSNYSQPSMLWPKPLVKFAGGFVSYNYNYYSAIDTPFAEQRIGQHNLTGSVGVTVAKALPFAVNFWIRRSNSLVYQDITDVQVSFDPLAFRHQLQERLREQMQALKPNYTDSLWERVAAVRTMRVDGLGNWLRAPAGIQRLHEMYERIDIDKAHPESKPTDSTAAAIYQQQLKEAGDYVAFYSQTKKTYDSLSASLDTLRDFVRTQRERVDQYKQALSGKNTDWANYSRFADSLKTYGSPGSEIPFKYRWLMGVRNFSLGKTPLNYSELTAKNINLGGINFEYNSWYYLAVSAGIVDYRFRDFVVNNQHREPQYLVMLRGGIGRLEKNYFIVSVFKGRKQLYNQPTGSATPNYMDVTGITASVKWQVNRYSFVTAEAGQSLSPDYRSTPPAGSEKFSWSGGNNKALAFTLFSSFPRLDARLQGIYKYTGANYQSFSSYQTNAALTTWFVKWDQNFFARKLRVSAGLRSNEFTNPYIVQNYQSNSVFTSVNVVFKARKWPMVSVGYMPMSQLSAAGQQIVENRFQTLTGTISHYYRIGDKQAFTTVVYNRFYNKISDSAFIYFNANNFYLSQQVVFKLFTAGVNLVDSRNDQYHLVSGEMSLRVPVLRLSNIAVSAKVNNLNQHETKMGGRFGLDLGVSRKDRVNLNYEKSWLPGTGAQLIPCDMGTIQYSRYF